MGPVTSTCNSEIGQVDLSVNKSEIKAHSSRLQMVIKDLMMIVLIIEILFSLHKLATFFRG